MTRPRKRAYENSDISSTRSVSKDDLIILQPACKLQDLKIQDTIEEVLRTNLRDVSFASWDSEARCDALSKIIQQKLCGIQHQFSDLAVVVLIGGVDDTGIVKASHKVWKPEYDSFASAWYKMTLFLPWAQSLLLTPQEIFEASVKQGLFITHVDVLILTIQ